MRTFFIIKSLYVDVGFTSPFLASCQAPGGIAHGYKFGTDYRHGKTVRYQCDEMHTLKGKTRLTCNDGKWNYNPPRCNGKKVNVCDRLYYVWVIGQA